MSRVFCSIFFVVLFFVQVESLYASEAYFLLLEQTMSEEAFDAEKSEVLQAQLDEKMKKLASETYLGATVDCRETICFIKVDLGGDPILQDEFHMIVDEYFKGEGAFREVDGQVLFYLAREGHGLPRL